MNGMLARGLALGLLVGSLQGCCFRSCTADANAGMRAAPGEAPVHAMEIVAWGPQRTPAGVAFNVQQGGQAALWIRLDQPLDAQVALIRFGDAFLEGQVSGDTVTAMVPPEAYARRGVQEVGVVARDGRAQWRSNAVSFTVE